MTSIRAFLTNRPITRFASGGSFHTSSLWRGWLWLGWLALIGIAWLIAKLPLSFAVVGAALGWGAALLLVSPWLIWPILAALLPFVSSIKVGPISGAEGLVAAAAALWFADGVRRRSLRLSFSIPVIATLVYAVVLYVALLYATDFGEAAREVLKWVEFALVILLVPCMIPAWGRRWLVLGLLVGGGLQGLLGLYQFTFHVGPEWFLFLGRYMRAYGSYNQPNPYAGYLGLTLPVALSLLLYGIENVSGEWRVASGGRRVILQSAIANPFKTSLQSSISWLMIGGLSSGLIGLGLLLSWSRGGWFGALAALAVVIFLRNRKSAVIGVIILVTLALLVLAGSVQPSIVPAPIADRLSDLPTYFGLTDVLSQPLTDENFAVVERIAHWVAAVRMWEQSPWIGVGPGNYAVLYPLLKVPGWDEPLGHAHNIYLNILAESGLVGLFAYAAFWLGLGGWSLYQWRIAKRTQDGWRSALILGVLAIFVHLAVHNIFDNLYVQGIYLHLALWIAVLYPMRSYRESC